MKDGVGSVQSVLVLGGGSDIARATCDAFVDDGATRFVLAARKPEELDNTIKELLAKGAGSVDAVAFDATDFSSHEQFVADTFARFGDMDVVLVAFGVLGDQSRSEVDAGAALEIVQANFTGVVSITVPLAQRLVEQGHGSLVLLSSVAGERARRSNYTYGASKAGADAFYQGLGDRLRSNGIHVMVVRPGFVHTKMTAGMQAAPLATTPQPVADAIVRGVRRGSDTVWVPPALRAVMSALRHLPRAVFRRLDI